MDSRQNFNPRHPRHPRQNFTDPRYSRHARQNLTHATHARTPPTLFSWLVRVLAQVFCCEYREIFRTLFYGTPPVTASGKNSKISVPAVFDCTWYHGLPLHCDKIAVKHDVKRKIFMLESIHTTIQTSKHLNKIKIQFCNDMYSTAEASLHSQSRWCFEIVFWRIECCGHVSIYLYKKKIVWELDVRSHVTQDL